MRFSWIFLLLVFPLHGLAQSQPLVEKQSQKLLDLLQLQQWHAATQLFTPALRQKIDSTQLSIIWKGLELSQGKLLQTGPMRQREHNSQRFYYRQLDFAQQPLRLELQFNQAGAITSLRLQPLSDEQLYLPPAYEQTDRYQAYSLRLKNDSIQLPGQLILPKNCRNCPIVLLLHDLGPQDLDHSIGPTKMFRDLAVGLAAAGIASYRYDKRTFRYGPELMADLRVLTPENEIIEDALAAIELLRGIAEIDTQQIYLAGLGVGGMLAGTIASRSMLPIRGILAIGSSPRPLPDQLLDQYIQLLSSEMPYEQSKPAIQALERQSERAKNRQLDPTTPPDSLPLQLPAPYWLHWQSLDPLPGFWQTNAKLWFVRGEHDYQSQSHDQQQWEMRLLGREQVSFSTLPQLNHLLMPIDPTATPAKAYQKQHNLDEAALQAIVNWLKEK